VEQVYSLGGKRSEAAKNALPPPGGPGIPLSEEAMGVPGETKATALPGSKTALSEKEREGGSLVDSHQPLLLTGGKADRKGGRFASTAAEETLSRFGAFLNQVKGKKRSPAWYQGRRS